MIVIYTTVAQAEQAELISQALLHERLVACVNMWPISSMYSWNGKIEESSEIAMFLKTKNECQDLVYKRLKELHPYECPAIITIDIPRADPDFVKWLQTNTNL